MAKPLLSIGMIFKNEIRCLERCMKSLQPLRDAIPCELVMADTGSDDGSRAVAEKYADILFDFPWIDDFAAARNAVMDRCSGEWFFSIDCDEWLDEDLTQLINCLRKSKSGTNFCAVLIRNYDTADFSGGYSDFLAMRLLRMSTGLRYTGAIHEHFDGTTDILGLGRTVLHHDGYVNFSEESGRAKRERNMKLLREKLEKDPDDMVALLQCIESSAGTWEYERFVRQGLVAMQKKRPLWKEMGPPILRHAVNLAESLSLPEQDDWIKLGHELFPNSPFVAIDIAYVEFLSLFRKKDYDAAISIGEAYLKALEDYRAGVVDASALMSSTLMMVSSSREITLRNLLADAYVSTEKYRKALNLLSKIEPSVLPAGEIKNYLGNYLNIYAQGAIDTSEVVTKLWEEINKKENNKQLRDNMLSAAAQVFTPAYRNAEQEKGYRHAYTVFLPLAGKWGPGTAAAILQMDDPVQMKSTLVQIEDWAEFPIHALAHALERGVQFPLPEQPWNIELMDNLAIRLTKGISNLPLAVRIAGGPGDVVWRRGLALAAIHAFDWTGEENAELGMELTKAFAKVEGEFLPLCYAPDMLREENLPILPAMHRFGWYCTQAFDALDDNDLAGYVRNLRAGLAVCESVKDIVEFLTKHTPQLQPPTPSAELLALAEQVRTMLELYPSDHPAVEVLKSSDTYQKVAYLIEGTPAPVFGGLAQ